MSKQYMRAWCVPCQDWKLFEPKDEDPKSDFICIQCGTAHEPTSLDEIPESKVQEQRDRYIAETKRQMRVFLEHKKHPEKQISDLLRQFSEGPIVGIQSYQITESDAGQKAIDEENQAKAKSALENQERNAKIIRETFKGIQRNDKCRCGSGKKFKNCCWMNVQYL